MTTPHRATYSPEDNKIRIYPGQRLDKELGDDYARFKKAGFIWAAKQECFVCPRWTPTAEDWALRLAGEIEDEDYSMTERSADRAERFEDYRVKRSDEADTHAQTYEDGPSVFGHQNAQRAQRQAERHERNKFKALTQWGKAEYWQYRTAGVIAHALYRARPEVRRGRIKVLEAEQRKHEKSREDYATMYYKWQNVLTLEGVDQPVVNKDTDRFIGIDVEKSSPAAIAAYTLANSSMTWLTAKHPRKDRKSSLYSLMTDPEDPITAREAAELWLKGCRDPEDENSSSARWSRHYELRLTYERTMLENEGGTAAAVEMVPGGWINTGNRTGDIMTNVKVGWKQIHAVVRSPVTKQITSVKVMGLIGYRDPKPGIVTVNIERLGEDAYRPPTEEELQAFKVETAERKAKEKSTKEPALPLINPTIEDADRLQKILNEIGRAAHEAYEKKQGYSISRYDPTPILTMTQKQYSEYSKGTYSSFETRTLHNGGGIMARRSSNMHTSEGSAYDKALGKAVCKVRMRSGRGGNWHQADHIVVITDKPQKPLPLDWDAIERKEQAA